MSGYSQSYRNDVLDNGLWTTNTEDLCARVGHITQKSFASHVEKQLIAYYMDCHWLFDDDEGVLEGERSLRDVLPTPPPAIITLDKGESCWDCLDFVEKIRGQSGEVPIRIVCVGNNIIRGNLDGSPVIG